VAPPLVGALDGVTKNLFFFSDALSCALVSGRSTSAGLIACGATKEVKGTDD